MIDPAIAITVIIPTRNRAESLRETLDSLHQAHRDGLRCEVIVADNGSTDHTAAIAAAARPNLRVHHVVEPRPGKGRALDGALTQVAIGGIVAILDDDMSPHEDWWLQVHAVTARHPEADYFTGHSYVIWPTDNVPAWARHRWVLGWAFSVLGCGREHIADPSRWFSGNHFWFRSRVLPEPPRWVDHDLDHRRYLGGGEARFMLRLASRGARGVISPDVKCGHRVQAGLLDYENQLKRAARAGRSFAYARLVPPMDIMKHSLLLRRRPLLGRLYCIASLLGWGAMRSIARLLSPLDFGKALRLHAIGRWHTYREYLRIIRNEPAYRLSLI